MLTKKQCVLDDDKICDNCMECDRCDLNPEKSCDNCMACVQMPKSDYAEIVIDEVVGLEPNVGSEPEMDDE